MNPLNKTILSLITLVVLLVPASPAFAASEQGSAHGKGNGLTKSEPQVQTRPQEQVVTTVTDEQLPAQSAVISSAKKVASAQTVTPAGNNGTIKIHEAGTPVGTENNDPKVCSFNVEGFGFDASQTGYLQFTVQGGDKPTGTDAGPYSFGPANANGFYASQYFSLANGHYKATLYDKMLPSGQLTDVKAKSKVFKVSCIATTPNQVPETPSTPDQNGQVLSASTTSDPTPMLANTGQSTLLASLTAVNIILASLLLAIRNKKFAEAQNS